MELLTILIFSISLSTLGIALLVISYFYLHLASKYHRIQKENMYMRYHMSEKSLQKVNVAREKSLQIIGQAMNQAEDIVKKAELLKVNANSALADELTQLTKLQKDTLTKEAGQLYTAFQNAITHVRDEDIQIFRNISKDIENITLNEMKDFEKRLHDETVGKEEVITQKTNEALRKANEEIASYKAKRMNDASIEVDQLLSEIAKEVLRKSLSRTEHMDIIRDAVERVKHDVVTQN